MKRANSHKLYLLSIFQLLAKKICYCPYFTRKIKRAIKSFDLMAFFFFHPYRHREVGDEKYDNTSDFKGQVIRKARTEIVQDSGGFGWVC